MLCAPASSLPVARRWAASSPRLPAAAAAAVATAKADSTGFLSLGKSSVFPADGRYRRLRSALHRASFSPGQRCCSMTASCAAPARPGEPTKSALRLLWLWCFVYAVIVAMHAAANFAFLIGILLPLIIMQLVCVLHVVNVLLYAR